MSNGNNLTKNNVDTLILAMTFQPPFGDQDFPLDICARMLVGNSTSVRAIGIIDDTVRQWANIPAFNRLVPNTFSVTAQWDSNGNTYSQGVSVDSMFSNGE